MIEKKVIQKVVPDLGVAAFLLMYGHQISGKRGKAIYFNCDNTEDSETFDKLLLEYQPPNEFYTFDSCLMFLKKISEVGTDDPEKLIQYKAVSDLGVAAYILLQEYKSTSIGAKVMARKGKNVYFYIPDEKTEMFEHMAFQYFPSQFHAYDSCLMSLKKMREYGPAKV